MFHRQLLNCLLSSKCKVLVPANVMIIELLKCIVSFFDSMEVAYFFLCFLVWVMYKIQI